MDHFLQIPQVGREWEDMLESYTTLGYLAGVTERIRLGTLVTGDHLPQPRPPRQGRGDARRRCRAAARCAGSARPGSSASTGSTAGTSRPCAERYALLEDALELLPLMWGPGAPRFEGRTITVAEAVLPAAAAGAHPDPRRRLGRAAHAAARGPPRGRCNLFGDAATVRHKLGVLRDALRGGGPRPGGDRGHASRRGRASSPPGSRARQGAGDRRRARRPLPRARRGRRADRDRGPPTRAAPESVTRFADVIAAFR